MSYLDDYMRRIDEQDIPRLRMQLEPLENGRMHLGERKHGAVEWTDTTQREINQLKRAIAEYEAILSEHRKARGVET